MKTLATIIALLMTHQAMAGLPPTTLSGQAQTVKPTTFTFKTPNNQSTKVSGVESLIETGNMNLLANPGFEHSTYDTSWTCTGTGTESAESSTLIAGKKALKIVTSSQTVDCYQDATLYASQLAGMQGYVQVWGSNTAAGVQICPRAAGSDSTDCITMATDGLWKAYEIPVVLSATSNGIKIKATSTTGTTILDEAYVGLISGKTPEVAQAQLIASAYINNTASCQWTRTSTTNGAFGTVAACPGPTIDFEAPVCDFQTTDTDLPRLTGTGCPPGRYVVEIDAPVNNGSAGYSTITVSDGTTTAKAKVASESNGVTQGITVSGEFTYADSGTRSWELYGAHSAGAIRINNNSTSPDNGLKFRVYYYPPSSKIYSQTNYQDTDWVDCGLTTGDFQGFGTVSSIEDLCKRDGSDLLVALKFTTGTVSASEARVNLKLLSNSLISAGSSIIPSLRKTGDAAIGANADTEMHVLIEPSVGYMTFGYNSPSTSSLTKATGTSAFNSTTAYALMARIPINGWVEGQITGTFAEMVKAPGISKPKTCYYFFGGTSATLASPTVCSSGTCVEVYDSCGSASPPTRSASGAYTSLAFASGTFANTSPVICTCEAFDTGSGNQYYCAPYFITSSQTWASNSSGGYSGNISTITGSGTGVNTYVQVRCDGQAP